jgi:small GTP-binding protein
MASELESLRDKAEELARSASDRPEALRARRLAERLGAGRFLIAVVGEFKRGKSTLVNALVGEPVLPTGVLPLTAVATELVFGEPAALVEFLDGSTEAVPRDQISDYVTEAGNPGNGHGVARVEVRGRWSMLQPGVVLVDTPGLASLHQHNTEAGRAALLDADGAIVVLSADSPISQQERELLQLLRERRSPTFFVLNKADHLHNEELVEVREFVARTITEILGADVRLFALDARAALSAATGQANDDRAMDFDDFVAEVSRFISDDLVTARTMSARNELARMGHALSDAVAIERAARKLAGDDLALLVDRFAHEAVRQRQGFEDDRTLLARDAVALLDDVGTRLTEFATSAPKGHEAALGAIAAGAPRPRLVDDLRDAIHAAVEAAFDQLRETVLLEVEGRWNQVAVTFRSRVQDRVDAARQAAADLFDVPLPRLEVPLITEQRDRFSFLFVRVGSTTEPLSRAASRMVPGRWARRRALARARAELAAEFDKHAGRARWDLAQRLDAARRELENALRAELDESIDAIVQAAERACQWRTRAEEDRQRDEARSIDLERLGAQLAELGGLAL